MIPVVDHILGQFSRDLGVDLGTANTLIYVGGKGLVIREPSIVAQHKKTKQVIAIGENAKKMIGKTPLSIITVKPLKDGVISDYDTTLAMLSYFVKKVHRKPGVQFNFPRPRLVIGVPSQITEVERRAILDVASESGARVAYLVEEPMAAAIGAGIGVDEPVGSMIVDIGGGTSEIAIISLGGVVVGRSLKVAGDEMDRDIINYVRTRYGLALGEKSAEDVKLLLGSAYPMPVEKQMVVRGRDLEKGLPKSIRLNSTQIREALSPTISTIVDNIRDTINDAPPELAGDVAERGIVICGGGALIYGLPKLISAETKMPVTVAADPLSCVVLGCANLLKNNELLERVKIARTT
ncbi:MAG: Rod shape-determining protein MreB [Candidatus Curtissbacteria bacterium GW2011_GWA1_41_11]|uniref:Cell shape-determining protein MreB n=1 Tax=Candidatus Curtissbacteria bacterium GW2011_GWA1_41_11 TaxID=1618409 RepID=A0A0G0UGA5_9BACT|nr:MAG: Rod shape-determining protein MreB [Candidatus Curtissbacteria bacterium GW2011_GWA1_41_11]